MCRNLPAGKQAFGDVLVIRVASNRVFNHSYKYDRPESAFVPSKQSCTKSKSSGEWMPSGDCHHAPGAWELEQRYATQCYFGRKPKNRPLG
jgi:hypothetical protein